MPGSTKRTCPNGHQYSKSTACPTCPKCEAARRPAEGLLAALSAPARRALEGAKIRSCTDLSRHSESEILALHGVGPSTMPMLSQQLLAAGLTFRDAARLPLGGVDNRRKARSARVAMDVRGMIGVDDLLRLSAGRRRDPSVQAWLAGDPVGLRSLAGTWFARMRQCGDDVLELLHDGCPVACVADAPFGYVNAFRTHVNVGFFQGAALRDPAGLLQGSGKRMRHVKLKPDANGNTAALRQLIAAAYRDIKARLDGEGRSASTLISERIAELGDWRGKTLGRMRKLIREAVPDVVEEWKWRGTPVWSQAGILCTGESYKAAVKLTFAQGAALKDPAHLFNASLDGNVRRAIDIHEGEVVDATAFKALVREAVAFNQSRKTKPSK